MKEYGNFLEDFAAHHPDKVREIDLTGKVDEYNKAVDKMREEHWYIHVRPREMTPPRVLVK